MQGTHIKDRGRERERERENDSIVYVQVLTSKELEFFLEYR
jgi:hypothetical protein